MSSDDMTRAVEFGGEKAGPQRLLGLSMRRGAAGKCPACGKGRLFGRFVATERECSSCGEELHHHRADDLPAYLNIFITGHVVIGAMMLVMDSTVLPLWVLTGGTAAISVAAAVLLMRPLKGAVVGAQWAMQMHGFGGHDD